MFRRFAKLALLDVAVFVALALFFSFTSYAMSSASNPDARWLGVFLSSLPFFFEMALLAPLVFLVTRKHRIGRGRGWLPLVVHAVGLLSWFGALLLSWSLFDFWSTPPQSRSLSNSLMLVWPYVVGHTHWYCWIALAAHAHHGARDALRRTREAAALAVENAELAARLTRVELDALKAQLQPHFLFNTHHAIAGLVRSGESRAALDLIAHLGDLLRYTLETKADALVSFDRELGFIQNYLAIQRTRFGNRLRVEWSIDDECRKVTVPVLLLQPLVENAVHHGVSRDRDDNHVSIEGRVDGDYLCLQIRNSTLPGSADRPGFGIGLRNVHERLERIYGDGYALELELVGHDEMLLWMRLPLRSVV